jgi:heme oxygenase
MYLRNLLVAYQALERGLTRYQAYPGVRLVACAELFRSAAIERDLAGLCGPGWAELVPLLSAGRAYAEAIEAAGGRDGVGLIGHAYTRYLGDLSGAQLLKRSLERSLGLGADCLAFYAFPDIADLGAFRAGYRTAIDAAADEIAGHDEVIAAAEQGFSHTIDIALAIQGASVR